MVNCNTCNKNILSHQSWILCKLCNSHYHTRCVYTDIVEEWYCFKCTAELFPFNHYVDDDEFKFALFCFDNTLDFNRMLSLKLNPFNFEDVFHSVTDEFDDLTNNTNPINKCSYIFNNDIKCSGDDGFSILHLNARSLAKNFDNIHNFISGIDYTFTVIAISETWLNEHNCGLFDIENYVLINSPRQGRRSGGSVLYVHNSVNYHVRDDLNLVAGISSENNDHSESTFIEILNPDHKNIIVGNVYRAHGTDVNLFINDFENCLVKISDENKQCYVSGDFNLDLLQHTTNNTIGNFLNMFYNNNMYPLIDRPTRITPTTATLIDNIFTNVLTHKINSGIFVTGLTDHFPIYQITKSFPIKFTLHKNMSKRLVNPSRIRNFYNHMSLVDWSFVTAIDSCEPAYDAFIKKFMSLYNIYFPIRSFNTRSRRTPRKPWITKALLTSIARKEKLYRKYVGHPTESNKTAYHNYRNRLTATLRVSKKNFYAEKLESCKQNAKQTWNILNSILGRQSKSNPVMFNINNNSVLDPQVIADHFNSYFVNLGPNLASKIQTADVSFNEFLKNIISPVDSLFLSPTDDDEVTKLCMSLKSSASSGHDDIKPEIVKTVSALIASPLAHIFNLSLASGIVPNQLKIARVVPIFKSGDRHNSSNYRPISVLPVFSKILERLIHKRLYSFISHFDMLDDSQFGFRSKRSSFMAIMHAYDKIVSSLDNKNHMLGIFLDLSKAFDTINHDILLSKLSHYGVRGSAFEWFRNYLTNRYQFVSFNGSKSVRSNISCGVPQGSILGPLLFIIYLNDIVSSSSFFSFFMYADDTNLLASHKNFHDLIKTANAELDRISTWLKANKLSLNIDKTNYILFKNKHNTHVSYPEVSLIKIDGTFISNVTHTKFLGIILDDSLSWSQHNTHVTNIVSKYSGIMYRLKHVLPISTLYSLYTGLVLPHIQYCNIIWADGNNHNLNSVHLKQKKIIRLCTHSHFLAHTKPLFHQLKALNVYDIYKLQVALFVYKFDHGLLPDIFNKYFQKNHEFHTHLTRSADLYRPCNYVSDLARNTIKTNGPLIWNSIDLEIRKSNTVKSFCTHYKDYLLSQYLQ